MRQSPPTSVLLSGTTPWLAAPAADNSNYHDIELVDEHWSRVHVPGHWQSAPDLADSDGPVVYRGRFSFSEPDVRGNDRYWLVLDGVFYTSDVWLDGTYLGDTEGYFFAHSFEVTDQIAKRSEHLVALEVACAAQNDRAHKRNLTGVFQHWDMADPARNPGGIWRDVRLERTGPVRIRHSRVLCTEANKSNATIFARVVLDTLEAETVSIRTAISPHGGGTGLTSSSDHPLAAGENRVEWSVNIPEPALWWPAALGDQPLYDVTIEVLDSDGRPSDRCVGRTGLRQVHLDNWICSINGERMFLKGSNIGPTKLALADATSDEVKADVALARRAGLDLLRVHGHIGRRELYECADEQGLLLWQDLPLQWGYARFVRRQARRQAREAVDLLGHHPSVAIWCAHNEPFTLDIGPDTMGKASSRSKLNRMRALKTVLPTWNKSILDRSIKSAIDNSDGTRPVIAHSGVLPHPPQLAGTDTHLWLGWHHHDERDLSKLARIWPRLVRFVGEFGAQAVPTDSSFLNPYLWPDLDWEQAAHVYGLQLDLIDRHVPRQDHATFESWRNATQRYQAELIRHHILTLRRLKYRPCGGFAQYCLADSAPAVSWAVLDHLRNPKEGYEALVEACRPVVVVADRLPAHVRFGDHLKLDVHVVSDLREALGNLVLTAQITQPDTEQPVVAGPWNWGGEVAADSCVRVGRIDFVIPEHSATQGSSIELTVELRRARTNETLATYRDHAVISCEVGPR